MCTAADHLKAEDYTTHHLNMKKSRSVCWWWPVRRMKEKRLRLRELLFFVLVVRCLWYGVFSEEYINEIENFINCTEDEIPKNLT